MYDAKLNMNVVVTLLIYLIQSSDIQGVKDASDQEWYVSLYFICFSLELEIWQKLLCL